MQFLLKPRLPQINLSHPLTKGLVFDDPFFQGAGTVTTDLSPYRVKGTFTNSPTWTVNLAGMAVKFNGSNSGVSYTLQSPQQANRSSSFESLIYPLSLGGSSNGRIFNNGSSITAFAITRLNTNNVFQFVAGWSGANATWSTPNSSITLNALNHVVVTYNDGNTSNVPTMYINGLKQTVTTNTAASGNRNGAISNLVVGASGAFSAGFDGYIFYTRMWKRLLNDREASLLYENPWRLYASS